MLCFRYGDYVHYGFVSLFLLERNDAVGLGKERVVAAYAYVLAGVVFGAPLAYYDVSGYCCFSRENFTPRRLLSESRPFLELPTPFLCAIFYTMDLVVRLCF